MTIKLWFYSINSLLSTNINIASYNIIDLDNILEDSHLTTLKSRDTPTLDNDGESPTIHALNTAASDAAYDLVIRRIP